MGRYQVEREQKRQTLAQLGLPSQVVILHKVYEPPLLSSTTLQARYTNKTKLQTKSLSLLHQFAKTLGCATMEREHNRCVCGMYVRMSLGSSIYRSLSRLNPSDLGFLSTHIIILYFYTWFDLFHKVVRFSQLGVIFLRVMQCSSELRSSRQGSTCHLQLHRRHIKEDRSSL